MPTFLLSGLNFPPLKKFSISDSVPQFRLLVVQLVSRKSEEPLRRRLGYSNSAGILYARPTRPLSIYVHRGRETYARDRSN